MGLPLTKTNPPHPLPNASPCPACTSPPPSRRRRILDGKNEGVIFTDAGTKGRLEGCDVRDNAKFGVLIEGGACPTVASCK